MTSFSQTTQQDRLRRIWLGGAGPSDRPRAPGGGGRARRKSGIIMSELGAGLRVPGSNASVRTIPCQAMHVLLSMSVAVTVSGFAHVRAVCARRFLGMLIRPEAAEPVKYLHGGETHVITLETILLLILQIQLCAANPLMEASTWVEQHLYSCIDKSKSVAGSVCVVT